MNDQPWWGIRPPEGATAVWGARAIHKERDKKRPLDFLPDRQSVSGAKILKKDFTVVLNELIRTVREGNWYTDEQKNHRSLRRPDMAYSFRVSGGYVYCVIYVKPPGGPAVIRYVRDIQMETEKLLIERACAESGATSENVSIAYVDPEEARRLTGEGGERWDVGIVQHDGAYRENVSSAWTKGSASYLDGVFRLLQRKNVWVRPWQEALREDLAHLPWYEEAGWFLHEDPQLAWRLCPEGRHLLWVIGHDARIKEGDPAVRDCARDIARWVVEEALPPGVDPVVRSLYYALDEGEASRVAVAARLPAIKDLGESGYGLDPAEVPAWHFERVVLFASLATFGEHRRLDYAAYDAAQLLYAVLSPPEVSRELAALVRRHFPKERFTR